MGDRGYHLQFDDVLRVKKIIKLGEYDCSQIHRKMDLGEDSHSGSPLHSAEGVRKWVTGGHESFWDSLFGNAWYNTLGDFVRVAYGHILLDEYWTKYAMSADPQMERDKIFGLALRTFINRGYNTVRFRRRDE